MLVSFACPQLESAISAPLVTTGAHSRLRHAGISRTLGLSETRELTRQLPMRSHALHRTQYDLELGLDIDLRTETRVDCAGERLSRSGHRGRRAEHTEKDPRGDPAAPDEDGRNARSGRIERAGSPAAQGRDRPGRIETIGRIWLDDASIGCEGGICVE